MVRAPKVSLVVQTPATAYNARPCSVDRLFWTLIVVENWNELILAGFSQVIHTLHQRRGNWFIVGRLRDVIQMSPLTNDRISLMTTIGVNKAWICDELVPAGYLLGQEQVVKMPVPRCIRCHDHLLATFVGAASLRQPHMVKVVIIDLNDVFINQALRNRTICLISLIHHFFPNRCTRALLTWGVSSKVCFSKLWDFNVDPLSWLIRSHLRTVLSLLHCSTVITLYVVLFKDFLLSCWILFLCFH